MHPEDFTLDMKRTNQRDTVRELGGTRANMYTVPWRGITRIPDYNIRKETDPGYPAHVAWLRKSIYANGYNGTKPMVGFTGLADGKPAILLTDGYSRLDGVEGAAEDGRDVEFVTMIVLPNEATARQVTIDLAIGNGGRQLTPLGLAIVCERLQRQGLSVKEIADHLAIEPRYVSDLRMLIKAPEEIRRQVSEGAIAATLAIQMLREDVERATERIAAAGAIAKAAGKKKVTAKHIKAAEAPLIAAQEAPKLQAPPSAQFDNSAWPFPKDRTSSQTTDARTRDLLQDGEVATRLEKASTESGPVTRSKHSDHAAECEMLDWLAQFFARVDSARVESDNTSVRLERINADGSYEEVAWGATFAEAVKSAMNRMPLAALLRGEP